MKNRLKFFDEASSRDIRDYLTVAKTRKENAGRPRIYNAEHDALLMTIMKEKRSRKLYQLRNIISEALQEEFLKVPANSTIWKHLHEQRQRRKRLNRHNVKKNPGLQLAYLERVSFVQASKIIDMDGIHFNPKDYLEKYGWSSIGEEAYILQLVIRDKTFSVQAAVCEDGFLAYDIYENNVTHIEVKNFIADKLSPFFHRDNYLILDNASNQKHDEVIAAMEEHCFGHYFYSSPYSPELKPIERAFSMVRAWIRDHENDTYEKEEDLIRMAFEEYSVCNPSGSHCYHLFDLYRHNHALFLEECE